MGRLFRHPASISVLRKISVNLTAHPFRERKAVVQQRVVKRPPCRFINLRIESGHCGISFEYLLNNITEYRGKSKRNYFEALRGLRADIKNQNSLPRCMIVSTGIQY